MKRALYLRVSYWKTKLYDKYMKLTCKDKVVKKRSKHEEAGIRNFVGEKKNTKNQNRSMPGKMGLFITM